MDIHRCRFIPYPPRSINALAFSHISNPKRPTPPDLRLAIGRENGDIEIWNPVGGLWTQETIFRGGRGRSVDHLAWTQDYEEVEDHDGKSTYTDGRLRLFSSGGSASITEWDISTGVPKRHAEAAFGEVWCFAVQPRASPSGNGEMESQLLAAGCSNGTIALFSTADDDLRFIRALNAPAVKKPKALSITWKDRNTIVAGYEDSTIRVIDVRKRTTIRTMTLGKGADGQGAVVWTVKCLRDGTIVSGDSSGELKIWDGQNYSLLQRLQDHQADILDIATNMKGDTIVSVGVDRRTVIYKQSGSPQNAKRLRWAPVTHRRYHRHDVKCAAIYESKDLAVCVSGGVDATPVVLPIRKLGSEYHRSLMHLPQRPQISASPARRWLLSWWESDVYIWEIAHPSTNNIASNINPKDNKRYELLGRIQLQTDAYIQSAEMSSDGALVVVTTLEGVKLFQIRKSHANGKGCIRSRQVELPRVIGQFGARLSGFSPDNKWLYAIRMDNSVLLAKINPAESPSQQPTISDKISRLFQSTRKGSPSLARYQDLIRCAAFDTDSRAFAVGDIAGLVHVWVLEGHEDLDMEDVESTHSDSTSDTSSDDSSDDEDDVCVIQGQKWTRNSRGSAMPDLGSAVLSLSFRPAKCTISSTKSDDNIGLHATRHNPHPVAPSIPDHDIKLVAVTSNHQIVEFDVSDCRLSAWSRRNPQSYLPEGFKIIKDRAIGCFWDVSDPAKGDRLWLYGRNWLFMLNMSEDLRSREAEKIGSLGKYNVVDPMALIMKGSESAPQRIGMKRKRQKANSGAGDAIGGEIQTLQSSVKVVPPVLAEDTDIEMLDGAQFSENDEDNEEQYEMALAKQRRGTTEAGEADTAISAKDGLNEETTTPNRTTTRSYYLNTFDYDSIFGIVAISQPSDQRNGGAEMDVDGVGDKALSANEGMPVPPAGNIEVIIVERPMYEVEQLPRFDGGQDWDA